MKKLLYILLLFTSVVSAQFYQVGGKNLTFSESYLEIDIETTDNQPFEITFEDGNTIEWQSGERLTYGYSNTYGQLEITAFSANVSSISLINNVAIDLSAIANLTALETLTDEFSLGSTITGSINNFNSSVIDRVYIANSIATIDGNISNFAGINYLRLQGSQIAATGDVGELAGIDYIYFNGNLITATGDIGELAGISTLYLSGNLITATGDIGELAGTTTLRLQGNQIAATGDIGELAGITTLRLQGNQIAATGDIGELAGINYLRLQGNLITATGDIGELAGVDDLRLQGNLIAATGDIGELAGIGSLYLNGNLITATGDIGELAGINYLYLTGSQIAVTYTSTTWSNAPSDRIWLLGQQTGLTATAVDNLFIDLSNATTIPTSGNRLIQITGNNAAPTSASLAARNALIAAGYTITTN